MQRKFTKIDPIKIIFIMSLILVSFLNANQTLAHGGSNRNDDHYQVSYTDSDISMKIPSLEIAIGGAFEKNVSVTEQNSSLTIIIEVARNGGTVWGLYFEKQSTYYKAKNGTSDPRIFSSTGLSQCCTKVLDHITYYAVAHITKDVGDDYVLALYNTHLHDEGTTVFDIIILNGHLGEKTFILDPPANDVFISILVLGLITGVGLLSIGLVVFILLIRPKRR